MTYLLFSKILREKLLDFKVYGVILCPQHFHNNFTTNFMWQDIFDE